MRHPAVLLIEGSDFETIPAGGQLAMVRALLKLYGDRLALVGMNRGHGPTGRWTQKEIAGTSYLFFPAANLDFSGKRPLIPARLRFYIGLRRFKDNILSLGCKAAFVQAPEGLLAVSHWDWDNLCFWFPGVENQLKASRYPFIRPLWPLFDKALFAALDRASVVLAAADDDAIDALASRSNGRLARERLIHLPTCVDTSVFRPAPADTVRPGLGIPANCTVFVTIGRIGRFKGWELLLNAFEGFLRGNRNALLFFVGDGEDRFLLQAQIDARGLDSNVKTTGFQNPDKVAAYLNAADVVVSGSLLEGWSVAMLEALACGKAIVATQVSGATTMIKPGQNGFIVKTRDAGIFARAMEDALQLSDAEQVSTSIASEYNLEQLGKRLASLWPPLDLNGRDQKQWWPEIAEAGHLQAQLPS